MASNISSNTGPSTDNTTIQLSTQAGVPTEGLLSEKVIIIIICVAGVALLLALCAVICHIIKLIRSPKAVAVQEMGTTTEPVEMVDSAICKKQNSMVKGENDVANGGESDDFNLERASGKDSNERQPKGYVRMHFHKSTEDISVNGNELTEPSKGQDSGIHEEECDRQDSHDDDYMEMSSVAKHGDGKVSQST